MATVWDKTYKHGKKVDLSLGWEYKKKARSLKVESGEKVTIYEKEDRQGKKSITFYEGEYDSLGFYSIGKSGAIHIEKCDLRPQDLIQLNWYAVYGRGTKDEGTYRMTQKLPIGDHSIGEGSGFPNDKVEEIEIPMGVTIEAFEDGSFKGGSLIFNGKDEKKRTRIKLKDFSYHKRVSSIKVTADDWELAGLALTNPVQLGKSEQIAGSAELANNSDREQYVEKTITATKSETSETNWNIGGRVMVKVEAAITTGIVETTVGGEVEVSGGYGESNSKTTETAIEDKASVTAPPHTTYYGSILVTYGKTQYTAERKWRNKVTGAMLVEEGTHTVSKSSNTRVEVH